MGTKSTVTGRGWGQNAAKGAGTGWGRGQEYILRGSNGVNHLSPCHSLLWLDGFLRGFSRCSIFYSISLHDANFIIMKA